MAKSAAISKYRQSPETCPHFFRQYEEEKFVLMEIICNSCGSVLWKRAPAAGDSTASTSAESASEGTAPPTPAQVA